MNTFTDSYIYSNSHLPDLQALKAPSTPRSLYRALPPTLKPVTWVTSIHSPKDAHNYRFKIILHRGHFFAIIDDSIYDSLGQPHETPFDDYSNVTLYRIFQADTSAVCGLYAILFCYGAYAHDSPFAFLHDLVPVVSDAHNFRRDLLEKDLETRRSNDMKCIRAYHSLVSSQSNTIPSTPHETGGGTHDRSVNDHAINITIDRRSSTTDCSSSSSSDGTADSSDSTTDSDTTDTASNSDAERSTDDDTTSDADSQPSSADFDYLFSAAALPSFYPVAFPFNNTTTNIFERMLDRLPDTSDRPQLPSAPNLVRSPSTSGSDTDDTVVGSPLLPPPPPPPPAPLVEMPAKTEAPSQKRRSAVSPQPIASSSASEDFLSELKRRISEPKRTDLAKLQKLEEPQESFTKPPLLEEIESNVRPSDRVASAVDALDADRQRRFRETFFQ